jgi:WD40 repeat protein
LCGVIVVIKDRYGNKIAEMEVPKAGSVIIKSNAEKPAASPHAAPQTAKVDVAAGSAKPDGKIERALAPQTDSLGPGGLASRPEPIAGLNGWNLVSREPLVPEADAAFHPTDPVLATAGPDGVIRIRDSATFEVKRAWPASSLWIEHLAWSPDGRRLAAIAQSSQDVMVWDYSSAKIAYVLSGHHGDVNRVAFSPDGALAATVGADLDPSLRIWDANDGRLRHVIPLPAPSSTLAWSSDSKRIATFSQGEKSVRIWEAATGSPLKTVACEAAIKVGAWKPGGKSIAVYCDDHVIRLIDARDDTVERRLPVAGTEVLALEWSPDGQFIAAGEIRAAYDFPVRVWNATTWEVVREFKPGKLSNRLHWSSDSQMLSAGGFFNALRNVTVFHVSKDEPLWTTKAAYFLAAFSNLAWSPVHERQAACGADKFVRLCNLSPLRTVAEFGGLDAPPATIAWSPDGARIAAIASNGQLALWDVATRQLRDSVRLEPRESWPTWLLGWSADGRTLVSGTYGPGSVKMWDVSAGRMVVREIEGGLGRGPLAVSPSGGLFAYQQDDGNATVIWDFATGEVRRKFSVGGVRACSWSPEGQRLCIVAGFQVSVYDVQGKQQPRQLQAGGDWWRSIEWSRDGARIALGGEYCIATCDAASRNVERRFSTPAEERQQLSFSPHCDSWLASASPEGAVRFWNIQRSVPQGFLLRREEKLTAVGINGHVSGDENQFLYVALTDVGRESFNASEFTAKYGWKNDPGGVRLIDFDEPPNDPAESRTKSPANEPRLRD